MIAVFFAMCTSAYCMDEYRLYGVCCRLFLVIAVVFPTLFHCQAVFRELQTWLSWLWIMLVVLYCVWLLSGVWNCSVPITDREQFWANGNARPHRFHGEFWRHLRRSRLGTHQQCTLVTECSHMINDNLHSFASRFFVVVFAEFFKLCSKWWCASFCS